MLCGVYLEYGTFGDQKGTYNAEGIKAIADAIVRSSLTQVLAIRKCWSEYFHRLPY